MTEVLILVGSDSDVPVVQACYDTLQSMGISVDFHIASAHRTPDRVHALISEAEANGTKVFIAGAGGAAHLAGAFAAQTTRPVIGFPLTAGDMGPVDSLYSTVNMPPGMPVATVSVGKWGAVNAALLAVQILGVADEAIAERMRAKRLQQHDAVVAKDETLQGQLKA